MTCSGKKPRYPFGIREEHLIALVMIPLLFSCLFTKPFIVQIEKFNTGFDTQLLIYSGLENQTVSINVSRYVTVGNWSQNGTFTNFTLEICPIAGAPSDITIYWPYTNNSQVMHAGPLVGCEEVDANASGFDPYFQTDSGIIIDAVGLIGGGGAGLLNTTNTMIKDGVSGELVSSFANFDTRHNVLSAGVAYGTNAISGMTVNGCLPLRLRSCVFRNICRFCHIDNIVTPAGKLDLGKVVDQMIVAAM